MKDREIDVDKICAHTPLPWEMGPLSGHDRWQIIGGPDGGKEHVADVNGGDNARLLTAAPELLAVVKGLMTKGHFYDCLNGKRGRAPDDGVGCSNMCVDMREAISKAEGGSA